MNTSAYNIKRTVFLLLIQLALLLIFYFNLWPLFRDFYNFEIKYLFTESIDQLKSYFPSYYFVVFGLTRLLKYGSPLLSLFLLFHFKPIISCFLRNIFSINFSKLNWWKNEVLFFLVSLFLALIFYYLPNYKTAYQLTFSRIFVGTQILNLILIIAYNLLNIKNKLNSFLQETTLPYSLAIIRILIFAYSIFLYLGVFRLGFGNFNGLVKGELPGITWLINIIPINNQIYFWACTIGALISFMVLIGYKTRFFLIINFFIIFYVAATPNFFGKLWHHQIIIWIPWILAFSPCYDVLSIDSFLKKKPLIKDAKYGFHLKIIILHFGLIYFFAGISKLWVAGFDWALSQSMINQVQLEWFENYNKIPAIRIDKLPSLLKIGGFGAILFEIAFVFFLFNKKMRWISFTGGLLLHNTIGYFMHINFLFMLQVFYVVFIPWNKILVKFKLINNTWLETKQNIKLNKLIYILPVSFLLFNFFCGLFRIDSYPFSAYPAYVDIVPNQFKYFEYNVLDEDYKNINLWDVAKESNFRWESFSRFEPQIIHVFETTGVLDTNKLIQQWQRWQNGIPILTNIDSVEVYAVAIYLDPELMNDTIKKYKLINYIK